MKLCSCIWISGLVNGHSTKMEFQIVFSDKGWSKRQRILPRSWATSPSTMSTIEMERCILHSSSSHCCWDSTSCKILVKAEGSDSDFVSIDSPTSKNLDSPLSSPTFSSLSSPPSSSSGSLSSESIEKASLKTERNINPVFTSPWRYLYL